MLPRECPGSSKKLKLTLLILRRSIEAVKAVNAVVAWIAGERISTKILDQPCGLSVSKKRVKLSLRIAPIRPGRTTRIINLKALSVNNLKYSCNKNIFSFKKNEAGQF